MCEAYQESAIHHTGNTNKATRKAPRLRCALYGMKQTDCVKHGTATYNHFNVGGERIAVEGKELIKLKGGEGSASEQD